MFNFFTDKKWFHWSLLGSLLILFTTWYKVQLDVDINEWFGTFYDMIQKALSEPGVITLSEYFTQLITFAKIAGLYVLIAVVLDFYIKHYIFRWRTSMNDFYMTNINWQKLRLVEGAAQRVQEDTRIFSRIMETLGVNLLRSILTLVAFLPLLWDLSKNITELPYFGTVSHALVYVAVIFAAMGTVGLAILGIKLPGLEYNNQVVEARYRKELVYGEDDPNRADPVSVIKFFGAVRKNYFRLFFHYAYFDVGKWSYLQFGVLVPYLAMGPTIVAGVLTLGLMQQIVRAFGRVEQSFQFLVNQWTTIVELISVWKRLIQFERKLKGQAYMSDIYGRAK
jgi:peptide/bleomycin uptake transporter|tara:strand:- start:389 stop:1399 length:1011 start_codon:yes stop_codon:yes gene_type:complete